MNMSQRKARNGRHQMKLTRPRVLLLGQKGFLLKRHTTTSGLGNSYLGQTHLMMKFPTLSAMPGPWITLGLRQTPFAPRSLGLLNLKTLELTQLSLVTLVLTLALEALIQLRILHYLSLMTFYHHHQQTHPI